MAQLIVIPQGKSGPLGTAIGEDVIAYYPFEETENFGTVIDEKNNFNGSTSATGRT